MTQPKTGHVDDRDRVAYPQLYSLLSAKLEGARMIGSSRRMGSCQRKTVSEIATSGEEPA